MGARRRFFVRFWLWRHFISELTMTDSQQLLAEYAKRGSESAFCELVTRYFGLVYSTALRLVGGDTHLAEDVAQTVFSDLARKAHGLSSEVMLGGWLHQHTYNVAAPMMRAQRRRQSREREAAQMNALQDDPGADLAQVAPVLDEAIMSLGTEDRTAIMLCFFERRDFRSIGQALGSSEDAARMRVTRALDKLHTLLTHRGVTLSAAALGTALATEAVTAAPAGLAGSVAATALASAAAGGATTLAVLKSMTLAKVSLGAAGVVVAGALVAFLLRGHQHNPTRPSEGLDQYIEITAGIDVTGFRPDPADSDRMVVNKTYHYTAVCTIGPDRWRIDHDASPNAEASLLCDSTNVYQLIRITGPLPPSLLPPTAGFFGQLELTLHREPSPEVYSARFIEISPGVLPLADVGANLPWLAFCSGHYLKRKDHVLPLLLTPIRISADAFAYKDKTSCFEDEFGLPRSVNWVFSGVRFAKSLDDRRLTRGDYMLKMRSILGASLREGVLRSSYTALEWTNHSGHHIPTKFELIEYGNNGEWSPKCWCKAVGQVTSIRPALEPRGVFGASTNQFVNDYRFRSPEKLVDFIHYNWPSNAIPSASDPNLVALFKRTETRAPANPRPVVHWWQILPGFKRR
jgi:RNA polymerase sigma factor (sigma-70 family)